VTQLAQQITLDLDRKMICFAPVAVPLGNLRPLTGKPEVIGSSVGLVPIDALLGTWKVTWALIWTGL
jgi:hypothetical protein